MTEQEWDAHEYNKRRGKSCPFFLAVGAVALVAFIRLLTGGRR